MFQLVRINYMYISQLNALQKVLIVGMYELAEITYVYWPI